MGAILIAPYSFFFLYGIQFVNAAIASIIYSTVPLWVLIIKVLFKSKKLSFYSLFGIITSIGGLILFLLEEIRLNNFFCKTKLFAYSIIFLSTLCFSYYSILLESFKRQEFKSIYITYYTFLGATISIIPIFLFTTDIFILIDDITYYNTLGIVYMSVFASIISFMLYTYSLKILGSQTASFSIILVPTISVFFGVIFYNDIFLIKHFLGIILITAGLYFIYTK